jgi:hypothetical protein
MVEVFKGKDLRRTRNGLHVLNESQLEFDPLFVRERAPIFEDSDSVQDPGWNASGLLTFYLAAPQEYPHNGRATLIRANDEHDSPSRLRSLFGRIDTCRGRQLE